MLHLHMSAEVPLQVELAGAVWALKGLTASMEVHVAQQVVHSVERLATYLQKLRRQNAFYEPPLFGFCTLMSWEKAETLTLHLNGFTGK